MCIRDSDKGVHEFLGILQFVREFAGTKLADITTPLRKLLRKGSTWQWTPVEQKAWQEAKDLISSRCKLAVPDYEGAVNGRPFQIFADMSNYAVGAALVQQPKDGEKVVPLSFRSKSLTATQMLWPAWSKELYSLKDGCDGFWNIIGSYPCIVWTDHANNARLETLPLDKQPAMHVRWWFNITYGGREVKYFAGRINWLGDGLSRNPEDRDEAQRLLKLVDTDPKSVLKLSLIHI